MQVFKCIEADSQFERWSISGGLFALCDQSNFVFKFNFNAWTWSGMLYISHHYNVDHQKAETTGVTAWKEKKRKINIYIIQL